MTPREIAAVSTVTSAERTMLQVGMGFAYVLRKHFPDFYLDHAAHRDTQPESLFGTAMAFLSLAHVELVKLDTASLGHVKPKDPAGCFATTIVRETCRYWLTTALVEWLEHPAPRVFGLGRDLDRLHPIRTVHWRGNDLRPEYARDMRRHGLAHAIWWLVSDGPWAAFTDEQLGGYSERFDDPLTQTIAVAAVPLTPPTPLAALCQQLDRTKPHGIARLGSIVAFVCGRTGNPYADWSQLELGGAAGRSFTLDWRQPRATLLAAREEQRRAASLLSAYTALDRRIHADPDLLLHLCQTIRATAGELLRDPHLDLARRDHGGVYDPARLIQNSEVAL